MCTFLVHLLVARLSAALEDLDCNTDASYCVVRERCISTLFVHVYFRWAFGLVQKLQWNWIAARMRHAVWCVRSAGIAMCRYVFLVHPTAFVVHLPHEESAARRMIIAAANLALRNKVLLLLFCTSLLIVPLWMISARSQPQPNWPCATSCILMYMRPLGLHLTLDVGLSTLP